MRKLPCNNKKRESRMVKDKQIIYSIRNFMIKICFFSMIFFHYSSRGVQYVYYTWYLFLPWSCLKFPFYWACITRVHPSVKRKESLNQFFTILQFFGGLYSHRPPGVLKCWKRLLSPSVWMTRGADRCFFLFFFPFCLINSVILLV